MKSGKLQEHLVTRQVDSRWLRRAAIEEFADASNSGRLVAFVGSYASSHLGYPSWNDMWKRFYATLDASDNLLLERVRDKALGANPEYDLTTLADLGELYAQADRGLDFDKFKRTREKFIEGTFGLTLTCEKYAEASPIARRLVEDLKVRRIITLNYDLELEWPLMTLAAERVNAEHRKDVWLKLMNNGAIRKHESRISRTENGRGAVASDIADVDRSEILIEFALRQPSLDRHILHLHGRVDDPRSTVVTRRDYRERYWQDGPQRLPYGFANRLLFLGNPVLFVGIGAKEPDVMRTLEQYLSDNPNRRRVPAFLLWNASNDKEKNDLQRVWFYRQYGIHVLFDTEIAQSASVAVDLRTKADKRMSDALEALAQIAKAAQKGGEMTSTDFRTPQEKFAGLKRGLSKSDLVPLWAIEEDDPANFEQPEAAATELLGNHRIKLIEGLPGSCRGACASALSRAVDLKFGSRFDYKSRVVTINAAFSFETDSLAAILSGAFDSQTAFKEEKSRLQSIQEMIDAISEAVSRLSGGTSSGGMMGIEADTRQTVLTIIINGADRFVAHDGSALSSEIDHLIRVILNLTLGKTLKTQSILQKFGLDARPENYHAVESDDPIFPVHLVLIGTARVRRYLDGVCGPKGYQRWNLGRDKTGLDEDSFFLQNLDHARQKGLGVKHYISEAKDYFSRVAEQFGIGSDIYQAHDRTHQRRQFYSSVLDPDTLSANHFEHPVLALEILRALAFIGQPCERSTLYHLPKVIEMVSDNDKDALIETTLDQLIKKKLVLRIRPFRENEPTRYGLHKTLITEFRERFGVPLSDSRLAAGFNLSLFAAQPSDNYVPDLAWHDDLGVMVDWLLGAYRDKLQQTDLTKKITKRAWFDLKKVNPTLNSYETVEQLIRLGSAEMASCVRAAVALLRGYYSIPALLMQDNRTLDAVHRDGPLTEHGERLRRVVRVFRDVKIVRRFLHEKLRPEEFIGFAGPNPLYSDDLLWVQNEFGVLKAAQGELYKARQALREAELINDKFVEFGTCGPNWIRLQMNQVQIDIERGKIIPAEERLRNIEQAINENGRREGSHDTDPFSYIIESYKGFPIAFDRSMLRQVYADELILLSALTVGYRGFCSFLRGALAAAKEQFELSIKILQNLGEMRAYSYFQRHLASLYAAMGENDRVVEALKLCVSAAGPGRQPDIDHSGRIAAIQYSSERLPNKIELVEPSDRIPQLMESYRYAVSGDMYRLQVETAQILAIVHLGHGDVDSALRYVHDAMAIAARGGFALRKITLRITLGRIHIARRDFGRARKLLTSAAKLATRIRYERAVEAAEDELIRCS